jgi:hypothetical protein
VASGKPNNKEKETGDPIKQGTSEHIHAGDNHFSFRD